MSCGKTDIAVLEAEGAVRAQMSALLLCGVALTSISSRHLQSHRLRMTAVVHPPTSVWHVWMHHLCKCHRSVVFWERLLLCGAHVKGRLCKTATFLCLKVSVLAELWTDTGCCGRAEWMNESLSSFYKEKWNSVWLLSMWINWAEWTECIMWRVQSRMNAEETLIKVWETKTKPSELCCIRSAVLQMLLSLFSLFIDILSSHLCKKSW